MKIITRHRNVRSTDEMDSLIENRILAFQPKLQMDEVRVSLECQWEQSPAYRVAVHVVTPGPDVVAEGRDHTIRAAIDKAVEELQEKIGERNRKALRRLRNSRYPSDPRRSRGTASGATRRKGQNHRTI